MGMIKLITRLVSCFVSNPKEEFNAHIDAPAEAKLAKLQHEIDMADAESTARAVEKLAVEHPAPH